MRQIRQSRKRPASSDEQYVSDSWDSESDVDDPTYQYKGSHDGDSDSDSDSSVQIPVVTSSLGFVTDSKMLVGENSGDRGFTSTPKNHNLSRKPRRRCPFCNIFQASLSRHIRLKHKGIKEVADAMEAPKQERLKLFD